MASLIDSAGDARHKAGKPGAETLAVCLVLACALQLAENLLPKIPLFPWLKLGLSHVVLLPFLLRFGPLPAMALAISRTLLTWMVAGMPLSSLAVALIAGAVSLGLVGVLFRPLVRLGLLGWVGLGIVSATAHNLIQLAVVEFLLVGHAGFFFQLAPLALGSVLSGAATAYLAAAAMPFWEKLFAGEFEWTKPLPEIPEERDKAGAKRSKGLSSLSDKARTWIFCAGLLFLALILFLPFLQGQVGLLVLSLVAVLWPSGDKPWRRRARSLVHSVFLTWPLLFFLAWLHLFHGEGHLIGYAGLTREGLNAFAVHGLRLMHLAILSPLLLRFFPRHLLEKSASPYARGVLLALPALAGLPAAIPAAARQLREAWRQDKGHGFAAGLEAFAMRALKASGDGSRE